MQINTVSLYVTDQDKARHFYVDQLGFEVRRDADMGPMGRWLEVAPPGAQTGFVLADAAGFDRLDRVGDSADLVLACSDIASVHASLVASGVAVTEPERQAWGTFIKVTDPDGQQIVLSQPRTETH